MSDKPLGCVGMISALIFALVLIYFTLVKPTEDCKARGGTPVAGPGGVGVTCLSTPEK